MMWPVIAGGLSAVVVFVASTSVIERRRSRMRREQLRNRLFK
jgi:hypothetical protein